MLKGKMKWIKPESKYIIQIPIPPPVLKHHRDLQLSFSEGAAKNKVSHLVFFVSAVVNLLKSNFHFNCL